MDRKPSFKLDDVRAGLTYNNISLGPGRRPNSGSLSEDPVSKRAREMLERWGVWPPGTINGSLNMIKRSTLRQLVDSGKGLRKASLDLLQKLEEQCWADPDMDSYTCQRATAILRASHRHVISSNGWWSRELEPSTCGHVFYEPRGFDRCSECGNHRSDTESCRRCYKCHKPLCEMCITNLGTCRDCQGSI